MISGIDVSHHNGIINWQGIKDRGFQFCFLKATEGINYTDSQFQRNWKEAPAHGLLTGAYCFFHPDQDALKQADHFVNVMGKNLQGRLPAVLDWETTGNMRNQVQIDRALIFLQAVESMTGKRPLVYCSPGFIEGVGHPEALARYKLWVAHYGVSHPRVPRPWTNYLIWQTSDAHGLDLNTFNGDINALKALAI